MAEKIVIEIDGKDNASATFKKVGMSVTDLNSAIEIATRVYDVAAQAFKMTVDEAQKYDQQIRDVMLSTGATAEESSRLVQVVDDAGVSYGTLKTAMKMASKEGIEPNIASLQSLSDQYLKLAPGVERNQFLLDKFGKSGLEMARVMELGGAALGKMNAEIDGGLVLTQEAIDQSEEYRKNVDNLSDSWQSFKVTLGNAVIPVLNDAIESQKKWSDAMQEAKDKLGTNNEYLIRHEAALIMERDAQIAAADAVAEHGEALDGVLTPALETATESVSTFSLSYEKQLDLIGDFTNSLQTQSEKLDEIKEKYGEGSQEYSDATAQFEEDGRRRILSMLEQQLSMDGLTQQEMDLLLAKGLAWGVYSQQAVDASRAAMEEVAALTNAINTIPSERTFTMSVLVQGADAVGGLGAGFGAEQWSNKNQHAAGGSFMIPMAYGNEGFRMGNGDTASGGELIQITPRGKELNSDSRIIALLETIAAKPAINEYILGQVVKESISQVIR